ncbi:MAG: hypothetical protein H6705_01050 [Myxococcales bacterium]|nr:hypothetical protein [Myxococcales bacterium]
MAAERDDETLLALLYDELTPTDAELLRRRLSPEDQARLRDWRQIRTVVAEIPPLEPDPQMRYDLLRAARLAAEPEEKPARWWAWVEKLSWAPAFAALALVVVAAGLTAKLSEGLDEAPAPALRVPAPLAKTAPAVGKEEAAAPVTAPGAAPPPAVEPPAPDTPVAEPIAGADGEGAAVALDPVPPEPEARREAAAAEADEEAEASKVIAKSKRDVPRERKPSKLAFAPPPEPDTKAAAAQPSPAPAGPMPADKGDTSTPALRDLPTDDALDKAEDERAAPSRTAAGDVALDAVGAGRGYAPPPPAPSANTNADVDSFAGVAQAPAAAALAEVETATRRPATREDTAPAQAPAKKATELAAAEEKGGAVDLLGSARSARAQGDHRTAVTLYEEYLAENRGAGGLDRVWFETAQSYERLGDTGRALAFYRLVAGGDGAFAASARDRIAALSPPQAKQAAPKTTAPAAPQRAYDFDEAAAEPAEPAEAK